MKKLYAPWRSPYAARIAKTKKVTTKKEACVFCSQFKEKDDTRHFIIKRTKNCAVILNLYPYNAGHLLVLPLAHAATLDKLSKPVRAELMELVNQSCQLLEDALDTDGINVGINLGKAAGAGIPSHLHIHVLPRFNGDTNFLPTLADTKQISFDLKEIYAMLKQRAQ